MVSIQITMYNYRALIDKIMQVSGHGEKKTSQISCFRIDAWYPSNLYD